jgi:hypothetical protein
MISAAAARFSAIIREASIPTATAGVGTRSTPRAIQERQKKMFSPDAAFRVISRPGCGPEPGLPGN